MTADIHNQLLVMQTPEELVKRVHRGQILKIKIEVDTDPPPGFETHTRLVLQPIPFAVRKELQRFGRRRLLTKSRRERSSQ